MRTYRPMLVGPAPTAHSSGDDQWGKTVLNLQADTIVIEGDLVCRRRAAQALAEAVGLSVVVVAEIPGRRELASALDGPLPT